MLLKRLSTPRDASTINSQCIANALHGAVDNLRYYVPPDIYVRFLHHLLEMMVDQDPARRPMPIHVASMLCTCLNLDVLLPLDATLHIMQWLASQPSTRQEEYVVCNSIAAAVGIHRGNAEALTALRPVLTMMVNDMDAVTESKSAQQLLFADSLYAQAMLSVEVAAAVVQGTSPAPDGLLLDAHRRAECLQMVGTARLPELSTGLTQFHNQVELALRHLGAVDIWHEAALLPHMLRVGVVCTLPDGSQLAVLMAREGRCFINAPDVVDGRMQVHREVLRTARVPTLLLDVASWEAFAASSDKDLLEKQLSLMVARNPALAVFATRDQG